MVISKLVVDCVGSDEDVVSIGDGCGGGGSSYPFCSSGENGDCNGDGSRVDSEGWLAYHEGNSATLYYPP